MSSQTVGSKATGRTTCSPDTDNTCQYCDKKYPNDGPGRIAIISEGQDIECFIGCLKCLVKAIDQWHETRLKCKCDLYRGCTCGAFQREKLKR